MGRDANLIRLRVIKLIDMTHTCLSLCSRNESVYSGVGSIFAQVSCLNSSVATMRRSLLFKCCSCVSKLDSEKSFVDAVNGIRNSGSPQSSSASQASSTKARYSLLPKLGLWRTPRACCQGYCVSVACGVKVLRTNGSRTENK